MSRSGDSTARIWRVGEETNRSSSQNGSSNEIVLLHVKAKTNEKSKDVTAIDWNVRFVIFVNFMLDDSLNSLILLLNIVFEVLDFAGQINRF